jgi:uncharacterized protein YjbI with pentapeptide repeats
MSVESIWLDWPACAVMGSVCLGRQVDADGLCLAHTGEGERKAIFSRLAAGGPVEAAAGVQFTEDLLADLVAALPRNDDGAPVLREADFRLAVLPALNLEAATFVNARFDQVSFQGAARFDQASFQGSAWFNQASFLGDVSFGGASFLGGASFGGVNFRGEGWFRGARFHDNALFAEANFQDVAGFGEATFQRDVWFLKASIEGDAQFDEARFQGEADFSQMGVQGYALFDEARFQGTGKFDQARFQGSARFRGARFQGEAAFERARFQGEASFEHVCFHGEASFDEARFQGEASFALARFYGTARFSQVRFQGIAWFAEASFQNDALFSAVSFQGNTGFDRASFRGNAWFGGASFQQPINLGPLAVAGTLWLDGVESDQAVQLEVAAWRLSCRRTRFRGGGHLRIAWAEVSLEDAEIPTPLIIATHPPARELTERVGWLVDTDDQAVEFPAPLLSLVSVQRADVAGLVLSDIDLRDCHFAGAHHLDQLQLTTADAFHRAPSLLARPGRPGKRGRQVLAEECRWRQTRPGRRGRRWRHTTSEVFQSPLTAQAHRPEPAELAAIYRRLRKGREDSKNEPGAADFYYGEMEMRRHAPNTPAAERLLLGLYWLTAGYALRASRALTTLVIVLATVTVLLALWGLPTSPTPSAASLSITGVPPAQRVNLPALSTPAMPTGPLAQRLTGAGRIERAARTALGAVVFRDTGQQLTTPGRYVEMAGRLLGPVLLALLRIAGNSPDSISETPRL